MSGPLVKYETAPYLIFNSPSCSACYEDCEMEDGAWNCARCGTQWEHDAYDKPGELYEDWAGEDNEGEPRTHDNGHELTQHERDNPKKSIFADFGSDLARILIGDTK